MLKLIFNTITLAAFWGKSYIMLLSVRKESKGAVVIPILRLPTAPFNVYTIINARDSHTLFLPFARQACDPVLPVVVYGGLLLLPLPAYLLLHMRVPDL